MARYAYLHGFASDENSKKGTAFAELFAEHGVEVHQPNLNHPSFSEFSYTTVLEAIDRLDERVEGDEPWRFIASSLGGYLASRWAQLNPERVDRMVLCCPGFNMVEGWANILGEQGIRDWEEEGSFLFFDADDTLQAVHWEMYRDARDEHPDYPDFDHEAVIIHGVQDEIVPVDYSRNYVEGRDNVRLIEVEDDHTLYDSIDHIGKIALEFFGV